MYPTNDPRGAVHNYGAYWRSPFRFLMLILATRRPRVTARYCATPSVTACVPIIGAILRISGAER
jgi:hypothetical protein